MAYCQMWRYSWQLMVRKCLPTNIVWQPIHINDVTKLADISNLLVVNIITDDMTAITGNSSSRLISGERFTSWFRVRHFLPKRLSITWSRDRRCHGNASNDGVARYRSRDWHACVNRRFISKTMASRESHVTHLSSMVVKTESQIRNTKRRNPGQITGVIAGVNVPRNIAGYRSRGYVALTNL